MLGQKPREARSLISEAEPVQTGSASSREACAGGPTHQGKEGSFSLSFVLRQRLALLMLEKYGNEGDYEHTALYEERCEQVLS